jgi:hypothetical protein
LGTSTACFGICFTSLFVYVREQVKEMVCPTVQGPTLFLLVVGAIIHSGYPGLVTGGVIQHCFDNVRERTKVIEVGCDSPAEVMQPPGADLHLRLRYPVIESHFGLAPALKSARAISKDERPAVALRGAAQDC